MVDIIFSEKKYHRQKRKSSDVAYNGEDYNDFDSKVISWDVEVCQTLGNAIQLLIGPFVTSFKGFHLHFACEVSDLS